MKKYEIIEVTIDKGSYLPQDYEELEVVSTEENDESVTYVLRRPVNNS